MNFADETKDMIIKCLNSKNYYKLNEYYERKTLLSLSPKIARDEETHSAFLAWLFNGFRMSETFALKKLLQLLSKKNEYTFLDKLYLGNEYQIHDLVVEKEYPISGGRLDIYIQCTLSYKNENKKLDIIIENKVKSDENDKQTNKYFDWAIKEQKFENPLFVYISPNENAKPKSSNFTVITYQDIVDYVIEPALIKYVDNTQIHQMLKDYLRTLSYQNYHKGELIMATNTEEIEILTQFYNENKELFEKVISAIAEGKLGADADVVEGAKAMQKATRKSNLLLADCGIPNGSILKLYYRKEVHHYITCKVIDNTKSRGAVEYEGELHSLSSAGIKAVVEKNVNPNNTNYAGTELWTYDGKHPIWYHRENPVEN